MPFAAMYNILPEKKLHFSNSRISHSKIVFFFRQRSEVICYVENRSKLRVYLGRREKKDLN